MLSDDEIFDLAGNYDCGMEGENEKWIFTAPKQMTLFARAIEAAVIERCAQLCENGWQQGLGEKYQGDVFAAAIRGMK